MHYRRFGRTNLQLSVFSLGLMRCLASPQTLENTVARAIELGVNHLETAQAYGPSQTYLGQALAQLSIPRDRLCLTSKIPPTPQATGLEDGIDLILQDLGTDYLDCFALHGINTPEHLAWVEAPGGCLDLLETLQQRGKIRHLGFSTHGSLELIERAVLTQRFAFVNLHYYYFFQRHAPILALAQDLDLGIFIISPADKGGQLYTPTESLKALCQPSSPLALTYRFLLSDPRITTLSVGAATPTELAEPLALGDQTYPLTPAELAQIAQIDRAQQTKLGTDLCHQCYQCLPCPAGIQIPEVLRLRNLTLAYGMEAFGQYRYGMLEKAGHWFPGRRGDRCTDCGDCLPKCPHNLNIPHLLRDTHGRLQGPKRRRLWQD
jgi:predicted aldo/keto reductase-like oxidoreductase